MSSVAHDGGQDPLKDGVDKQDKSPQKDQQSASAQPRKYRFDNLTEVFFALMMYRVRQGNPDIDLSIKAKELIDQMRPPANTRDIEGQLTEIGRVSGNVVQVAAKVLTAIKGVVVV